MRIWHEKLIPKLCRQHLLAMWREGLGAISILTYEKKGYRNHPAIKEFEFGRSYLYDRMQRVRYEMILRGYHPKELEYIPPPSFIASFDVRPWQSLEEQIEVLKSKKCKCNV